ncbi:KAP family NTPase [Chryseobacterium sp. JUb7]|uniref:KAP family NTPase n=1 Tax=Chryseobacterium sp. JUb7 TaxID=2940599 RepID=UPI00216A457E|nr:KAP family NTPase [Chryseobacterium sp. JUb7]MCS3528719.1 hypothetical protein [Chryseobacterium sp. JUb7]
MKTELPKISLNNIIELNSSPNKGDIAITSINDLGTEGQLNSYVLKEYGYSEFDLPQQQDLANGIAIIKKNNLKPILFVVTVNGENVSHNLKRNLLKSINFYHEEIIGKKLWIPLMGVGVGSLSLYESYRITVEVINKLKEDFLINTTFIISIPSTQEGVQLFNEILNNKQQKGNYNQDIINFTKNYSGNFYCIDDNNHTLNRNVLQRENYPVNSSEYTIISRIQKNDIIIVKNAYINAQNEQLIRIKSIGVIKEKKQHTYKIDWLKIQMPINIDNLDFLYSKYFVKAISKNSIRRLLAEFHEINPDITKSIFSSFQKEKIAGLISDSDDGIDYLEIEKDINAFSKVIAAKNFEPPLAISLFGKWGSGKSFFMKKLKNRIIDLSENSNFYCEGIVQIHFNAWSYIDSNLWASIVTRIFEELNIYISDNTLGESEKKMIEQELTSHLSITKEEIGVLNNKKQIVKKEIDLLKRKRKKIQEDLSKKISQIKKETIWNVIQNLNKEFNAKERILKELNSNPSFSRIKDDIEKNIPEEYLNDPKKVYEIAKSRYTFFKEFFKKDKIVLNLVWLFGILTIIILFPLFLDWLTGRIKETNFIIPQATLSLFVTLTAVWKRAENVYKDLKPLIASFWNIKEEYEKKVEEVTINYEKEKQVLIFEIKENKSKILIISEQIQNAERKKTDIEFRINNALATETLYSFIDKRSKSNDYQKHLGIISIIRKDFEILSDLFIGHHKEIDQNNSNNDFKSKFKKPLERIILYIDDLDRCPEENVVQVLEAVNLLMAFPLFVVVVGVDSRWIKNALNKKYNSQFKDSKKHIEVLEVSNYLEKIFQIPFHLKDANSNNVKDMIKNLAQHTSSVKSLISENFVENNENINRNDNDYTLKADTNIRATNSSIQVDYTEIETTETSKTDIITNSSSASETESLILADNEIQLMQDMSEIIGNNPRCIKRFVNIFRVIKAHEEFGYSDHSLNQEIIAILFLIALPLGKYKKLVPSFENFINKEHNSFEKIRHYFELEQDSTDLIGLRNQLENILFNTNRTHETLLNMNTKMFKDHNMFIRRFTFSQI